MTTEEEQQRGDNDSLTTMDEQPYVINRERIGRSGRQVRLSNGLTYLYDEWEDTYFELTEECDKMRKCIETKQEIIEFLTEKISSLKVSIDKLKFEVKEAKKKNNEDSSNSEDEDEDENEDIYVPENEDENVDES